MEFVPPVPPGDMDFGAWLATITPPGGATVAVLPPGADNLTRMPQIRPAIPSPQSRRTRKRRGSAPAMHAAYLVDVTGLSPSRLVSSGLFDFTSDRNARQHVRDGRLTAADLGAWPWAVVDGRPLPRNWWADPDFARALEEWALGDLHFLGVDVALQRPRSQRFTASARLPVA